MYLVHINIREREIKLLAYLIGDGCLTDTVPKFSNINIFDSGRLYRFSCHFCLNQELPKMLQAIANALC